MNTISVNTTQNVSIAYDVAGIGERFWARLIDFGFMVVVFMFFGLIASFMEGYIGRWVTYTVSGLLMVTFVFYDFIAEYFYNGQSAGKYLMKIRVISLDGYQPSVGQYLLRWAFRFVDFTISMQVGGLIAAAITPNKQRIGDIVAGTTVIRTVPRAKLEDVAFVQNEETESYVPRFPDVIALNDGEIGLIHEVITDFNSSGNNLLVYKMAVKVQKALHLDQPQDLDELAFLKQVVKDYAFLTSRE
ncbi:RDD family protein [Olivibacter sitiensis]|uniref:RDD family protein n=1 Tax=Olivibacter sitiensis TaxID=376470 RepID=UPI0003F6C963|nr:RDD family protein [Olivibacter sitiensis]